MVDQGITPKRGRRPWYLLVAGDTAPTATTDPGVPVPHKRKPRQVYWELIPAVAEHPCHYQSKYLAALVLWTWENVVSASARSIPRSSANGSPGIESPWDSVSSSSALANQLHQCAADLMTIARLELGKDAEFDATGTKFHYRAGLAQGGWYSSYPKKAEDEHCLPFWPGALLADEVLSQAMARPLPTGQIEYLLPPDDAGDPALRSRSGSRGWLSLSSVHVDLGGRVDHALILTGSADDGLETSSRWFDKLLRCAGRFSTELEDIPRWQGSKRQSRAKLPVGMRTRTRGGRRIAAAKRAAAKSRPFYRDLDQRLDGALSLRGSRLDAWIEARRLEYLQQQLEDLDSWGAAELRDAEANLMLVEREIAGLFASGSAGTDAEGRRRWQANVAGLEARRTKVRRALLNVLRTIETRRGHLIKAFQVACNSPPQKDLLFRIRWSLT